jgi:ubiquinone biosynthesis monooxygenase Coq7
MKPRRYDTVDELLIAVDQAIGTVFGRPRASVRPDPAQNADEGRLGEAQRRLSARLMRVNHTGEICAQALYQGQAQTASLGAVRDRLEQAALEENDHLRWCETRLGELGTHTSVLNPLFYAGSRCIGAFAGKVGDGWSLGFVAETEQQVVQHLSDHLNRLPAADHKSRAILAQMQTDEGRHATTALEAGGEALPLPVKLLMRVSAKLMTGTTYWV